MATNPTSSNILSGIQSIQGNRHAARLNSYNQNLAERQVYDTTSELLANQIQQQEKQNKFISNALGIKNTPSSNNMWNSHHALLSEEYEAMFNDDVLKAVSQDEMLSAKWLADLNELNKRINEAEQFFSISFGDPSKGPDQASYSGWMQATQNGQIQYNDYWKNKGLSTTVTNQEFKQKAAELDTKLHESVTYIPGQGFDVKYSDGSEKVFDFSPKNASEWFFVPTEQAVFNPPVNYSNDNPLYEVFEKGGDEAVRANLQSRKITTSVELDVAEFARKRDIEAENDPDKKAALEAMTARDYRDKLVNEETFETQYQKFEDAVVEGMKTREQRQKGKENARTRTPNNPPPPPEDNKTPSFTPLTGDNVTGYNLANTKSFLHTTQGSESKAGSFVRAVKIDEDGDISAVIQLGRDTPDTETIKLNENNIHSYAYYAPQIYDAYNALTTKANFLRQPVSGEIVKKIQDAMPPAFRSFIKEGITINDILQNEGLPEEVKIKVRNIVNSKSGDDQEGNPFWKTSPQ